MHDGKTFDLEFQVGASESDCFGRLRPSSLMHFIQEVAIGHALECGVDRAVTMERLGSVWMVLRVRAELKRPILYDERVLLRTWVAPVTGASFPRETEIFVGGESVGEVSATWVVANIESGRIVRPRAILEIAEFPQTDEAKFAPLEKISPIEPLGAAETHRVRYSDLDMNRHVHNTRYTDFAADHIDLETIAGKWVRSMSVSFSSQCVAGEELLLASARDGDRYYIRGTDPTGKLRFEQEFILADD